MVVSSYLGLQWIHLALLVRVGGMFFREDFISGSVSLKLGAPRFSGYLQNRRCYRVLSCGLGAVVFIHKEVARSVDWALLPLSTRN